MSELAAAGFWNYLREDITLGLISRRGLQINSVSLESGKSLIYGQGDDYNEANAMTLLLAQIISAVYNDDGENLNTTFIARLFARLDWKWQNLSTSFKETILFPKVSDAPTSTFVSIYLLKGSDIATQQYYYTARAILVLAEARLSPVQTPRAAQTLHEQLDSYAQRICGAAISISNHAARVNAFGPISFCGIWLTNHAQRAELVSALRDWRLDTAWPVEDIIDNLQNEWT